MTGTVGLRWVTREETQRPVTQVKLSRKAHPTHILLCTQVDNTETSQHPSPQPSSSAPSPKSHCQPFLSITDGMPLLPGAVSEAQTLQSTCWSTKIPQGNHALVYMNEREILRCWETQRWTKNWSLCPCCSGGPPELDGDLGGCMM